MASRIIIFVNLIFILITFKQLNTNNLLQRIKIIFGIFMIFFYISFGMYFIFSPLFVHINIAIRTIFGVALALYGLVRALRTYEQVRDEFFRNRIEED